MAGLSATEPDNRLNYARSSRFVYTLGQRTMLQAFNWLYKGGPFTSHPGNLKYMYAFTRKQIKDGVPPSEMDITSLYQLLRRKCNLAPDDSAWASKPSSGKKTTLEQALVHLKNSRFSTAHPRAESYIKVSDIQLDELMEELRALCTEVLRLAGERATVAQDEVDAAVSKMHEDFNQERYAESALTEEEFLKMSRHDLQRWLVSPKSYYLPPQLVVEQVNKPTNIPLTELFCQTCKDGSLPQLIVVEGETGSGKTSLCRYLMNSWLTDPSTVQHLRKYQLVVMYDCGRINTCDVHDLLCTKILPTATSSCSGGDLRKILERLKVLWLMDGLEEAAREGQVFLRELLQTQPSSHTILVASRREQSALLTSSAFPKKNYLKVSLVGLNDEEREMFLRNKMRDRATNNTEKSIEKFIVSMRGSNPDLQNYLRNPLWLMLTAKLWCEEPIKSYPESSLKSLTKLYMAMKDSSTKQLVQRAKERTATYEDAQQMIDKWFRYFCKAAFESVKENSILKLDTRREQLLRKKVDAWIASLCLSTFLEFRPSPDDTSGKGCYVFSHYSQQCFYAALYLNFTCSHCPDPDGKMKKIFEDLSGNFTIDPYLGIYDMFTEIFDISMIVVSRVSFGWFCPQMKRIGFCQRLQRFGRKMISLAKGTNPTGYGSCNMNRYYPVLLHVLEMKDFGYFTTKISAETLANIIFMLHNEVSPQRCFEVVRSFNYQEDLVREVARRMKIDLWKVADIDLKSAWELLSYIIPGEIIITISSSVILSDLEIILFMLARKQVRVHLHLQCHYGYIRSKDLLSDTYLSLLCDENAKCQLVSFVGYLSNSSIERLINSSCLESLSLRVTNVSAINLLGSVTLKLSRLRSLDLIYDCTKFVTLASPLDGSFGFRKFIDRPISVLMLRGYKPLNVSLYLPHLSDASAPAAVNFISSLSKCYLILCIGKLSHSGGKKLIHGLEQNAVRVANLLKPIYIKKIARYIPVRLGSLPLEIPVKEFVGQWHDISKINI
ncbi:uncharacterized protein [Panulirus ornatus]|uniref:uncharacterized protein n=1 Tax=Panulirus ornatus TaxID=150431 RepID=UPI003A8B8E07